jgi:mono/diheme cytochrome c family protein
VRLSIAVVLALSTLASPASAGVRVVPTFDPAAYADRAAVGLLVPGAGPTVTREGALAALVRGEVEHSLLDGVPEGEPLIVLGAPGPPEILVSLPPPGRSENDRRYTIAVLGWRGVLTSDSTRIDGLVSVTDIAHMRLRAEPSSEPVEVLERLDDRIERNDRLRLPLTFLVAFVVLALAVVRPPLALRAILVALAANLLLSPWLAAAAVALALLLPLGAACAAVLVAYLVALGLDAETVALSPLGPSQSGRFYGINNLLETLLLVPALVGPALLGRRLGIAVAAVALVTIGGNRFGADGGGLIVLLAGYAVLALQRTRRRPTLRLAAAGAAAVVVAALALVALDAATGGESHVTRAVGDGPGALAADLGDRLELSARRATGSAGAVAVVVGSLAVLAYVLFRLPRSPLRDAFLAALLVSVLVNDTPTDVLGVGAAAAVALARAGPLDSPPMRRPAVIALLALLAAAFTLGLSACGGSEEVSPVAETVEGSLPAATTEEAPASTIEGDPAAGEEVWASAQCGSCHTLAAANGSGTIGPNLDESQPSLELAVDRVTNGAGAMPPFEGQLTDQQIADVAAFVVESTSG